MIMKSFHHHGENFRKVCLVSKKKSLWEYSLLAFTWMKVFITCIRVDEEAGAKCFDSLMQCKSYTGKPNLF